MHSVDPPRHILKPWQTHIASSLAGIWISVPEMEAKVFQHSWQTKQELLYKDERMCYVCGKEGHIARVCPEKKMKSVTALDSVGFISILQ